MMVDVGVCCSMPYWASHDGRGGVCCSMPYWLPMMVEVGSAVVCLIGLLMLVEVGVCCSMLYWTSHAGRGGGLL